MSSVRVSPTFVTPVPAGTFAYALTAAPRKYDRGSPFGPTNVPAASGTVMAPSSGTGKGMRGSTRVVVLLASGKAMCAAGQTHHAKFDDSGVRTEMSKSPGSRGRLKDPS